MNADVSSIRREVPEDAAAIRAVHLAAFPGADEADLVDRIRRNGNARVSLVAEADGRVVGHVLFSPVRVVDGAAETLSEGLGLAPLAVLPAYQRRGIGSDLVRAGLQRCRALECKFVVVLGHSEYYPRFGFQRASRFGLANEYGADEAFFVQALGPNGLCAQGLVKYGAEFGAFSGE